MIPAQFDYVRPADLDEALKILTEREGEAKLLAGGYSLIPLLKLRLAQPGLLVDLRDVTGLDGIVETDDELRDRRSRRRTARSTSTRSSRPLPAAPRRVGRHRRPPGPQLGHDRWLRGPCRPSVGLAGGAPRRRTPAIVCRGQGGERVIAARDFFLDTFPTAIEPTEVLTEIRFGRRPAARAARTEARAPRRRLRDGRRRRRSSASTTAARSSSPASA